MIIGEGMFGGQSKVSKAYKIACVTHQNVLGFKVTVIYALRVAVLDGIQDLVERELDTVIAILGIPSQTCDRMEQVALREVVQDEPQQIL